MLDDSYTLQIEQPLRIADSDPEPDLAIMKDHPEEMFDEHPETAELVVEIANTSLDFDRDNAVIYAQGNIFRSGSYTFWSGAEIDLREIFR